MEEFVRKIAQGKHGITSLMAQQCLDNDNVEGFIDYLGQQAVQDAPDSVRRLFGDELYDEIVELYKKLPEEKKTYTTGKPDET